MSIEQAESLLISYPDDAELSVIHRDDCAQPMRHRQLIDAETADALVALGDARRCDRCHPAKEEAP